MKSFLFMLLGLVAGCGIIYVFFTYTSIPIIPCIAVYATYFLCAKGVLRGRTNAPKVISSIILAAVALFGVVLYGYDAYRAIAFFPDYMNVLGIIFAILTAINFIVAWGMFFKGFWKF